VQEADYTAPVMCTLGGKYHRNGQAFGVTCAHCLTSDGNSASPELPDIGTAIMQPTAMGKIIAAANRKDPSLIGAYNVWKDVNVKGPFKAMHTLVTRTRAGTETFSYELPADGEIGTFAGGRLGALSDGTVVDVAVVRLATEMKNQCTESVKWEGLVSPPLVLGDNNPTPMLSVQDFPPECFYVYGRGARSSDTMRAVTHPLSALIRVRDLKTPGSPTSYRCIHVNCPWSGFNTGDSGMWVWTEEALVGMAIGKVSIEGHCYCVALPMAVVLQALEELTA
jgi:hypothetical protein